MSLKVDSFSFQFKLTFPVGGFSRTIFEGILQLVRIDEKKANFDYLSFRDLGIGAYIKCGFRLGLRYIVSLLISLRTICKQLNIKHRNYEKTLGGNFGQNARIYELKQVRDVESSIAGS